MPRGRKTICTPERIERIANDVSAGNYAQVAARANGISIGSYFAWLKRAEEALAAAGEDGEVAEGEKIYVEFLEAIKQAEAEAERNAVAHIQKAAPDNWPAAMTYLERRFSSRWARGERRDHNAGEGRPIEISVRVTGDVDEGATG